MQPLLYENHIFKVRRDPKTTKIYPKTPPGRRRKKDMAPGAYFDRFHCALHIPPTQYYLRAECYRPCFYLCVLLFVSASIHAVLSRPIGLDGLSAGFGTPPSRRRLANHEWPAFSDANHEWPAFSADNHEWPAFSGDWLSRKRAWCSR